MPNSFDRFPTGDALVKKDTLFMSASWASFMEFFYENLISYLTEFGIFLPELEQSQIDDIQSPVNGQLLYNTTVDAPQFYQVSSGSWRTISFT